MTPSDIPPSDLESGPDRTQKLALPEGEDPRATRKLSLPLDDGPQAQARPPAPRPGGRAWKGAALLGGLAVAGAALYLVSSRGTAGREGLVRGLEAPVLRTPEAVPPGAQAYLDLAGRGDAHAMRMLGVMYYYGLNVPQDREKGLQWYRKAAEQGSEAARAELAKLEGPGK